MLKTSVVFRGSDRGAVHAAGKMAEGATIRKAGNPPYGWRWAEGGLVENPAEQRAIARVLELHAQGLGRQTITDSMVREGFVSREGTAFYLMLVRNIIKRNGLRPRHAPSRDSLPRWIPLGYRVEGRRLVLEPWAVRLYHVVYILGQMGVGAARTTTSLNRLSNFESPSRPYDRTSIRRIMEKDDSIFQDRTLCIRNTVYWVQGVPPLPTLPEGIRDLIRDRAVRELIDEMGDEDVESAGDDAEQVDLDEPEFHVREPDSRPRKHQPKPLTQGEKATLTKDTREIQSWGGPGRPRVRGECEGARVYQRPCPWVSCKYHLFLDVDPKNGSIKLNFPGLDVWELPQTCALDVAEEEGVTLETVGVYLNLTRERVRQLEAKSKAKTRSGDREGILEDHADPPASGRGIVASIREWYGSEEDP